MKLLPSLLTKPRSRLRVWLVGVGTFVWIMALLRLEGGSLLQEMLKGKSWEAGLIYLGALLAARWVGHRFYEQPNPLTEMPLETDDIDWDDPVFPHRNIAPSVRQYIARTRQATVRARRFHKHWVLGFYVFVAGLAAYFSSEVTDIKSLAVWFVFLVVWIGWPLAKEVSEIWEESKNNKDMLEAMRKTQLVTTTREHLSNVESLKDTIASLERDMQLIGQEVLTISDVLRGVTSELEQMEERATVERGKQQRQMSELLQLAEAVLAHQPPRPNSD